MRLAQSVPTTLFFIHLEVIMQFPRSEAEIAKLTVAVAQGLEDAAQDFPAPPVPPAELRASTRDPLMRCRSASDGEHE